jgi:hypothetical protein
MARYQPPGGRGPQRNGMLPNRRQLPPPEPAVRQRALAALRLGVLSLLGLMLGLGNLRRGIFVAALTLLFAATAIWLGVTASKMARRAATARPRWAVGGVVLGAFGLAFSALWLMVLAVFWPQLNAYYTCMNGANTVTAQQACHDQFTNSVGNELSVLQGGRLRGRSGLLGVLLDDAEGHFLVVIVPVVLVVGGPRVQVDPVAAGVVGLVVLARRDGRLRGLRAQVRLGLDGLAVPLLRAAQDEPVGGRGGQRGGDADLKYRYQTHLEAGRPDRGQAAVAERAAREGRSQAGQRT